MAFRSSHKAIALLLLCAVIGMAVAAGWWRFGRANRPASAVGGAAMDVRITCPVYKQADAKWMKQTLGSSTSIMASEGCTVCCLAMALTANGYQIDPGKLNKQLGDVQGYTESGLLIWAGVGKVTGGKFDVAISNSPTNKEIDRQLENRNPVLAKIYLREGVQHWVLLTGKRGKAYLMHDPLGSAEGYEALDCWDGKIYRVRYLVKNDR